MLNYMFIYNVTLAVFFSVISSTKLSHDKSLTTLGSSGFDSYAAVVVSICLFSMAGVPPFMGFFSKLFVINTILNSALLVIYFLLFVLLFSGLYFYMQNMRSIHSSRLSGSTKPYLVNEKIHLQSLYFCIYLTLLITLGVTFIDDTIAFFS